MLPGIDISFENGALGAVVPSPDGLLGLLCNAVAVPGTFELNTPYLVTSMVDVADLGITDDVDNHIVYKALKEFYDEAGTGTELWIMAVGRDELLTDQFVADPGTGKVPVQKLLDTANGRIRGLLTAFNPDSNYVSSVTDELEDEVMTLAAAAQSFAESYTQTKFAPFFVLTEAYGFTGTVTGLPDLTQNEYNRVGILIGDTESRTGVTASKGAAIGILGGRVAKNAVHVNIGRVRDGALLPLEMYIVDEDVETANVGAIHDLGFITFRTHVARSGYFFSDDPLATLISDDYHYLARRRVIDKAYRIAYDTLLNYLLDDFTVNEDGSIDPRYARNMSSNIEQAIFIQMTANGELSRDQSDSEDLGVVAEIDLEHNVTSTSTIKLKGLKVKPKGYGRWIDVPLGFVPVNNN